jgi:hypothetical protein
VQYIEKVERVIDHTTGDVLSHESKVINVRPMETEPDYIKMYVGDLGRLKSLSPAATEILIYVAATVDYDGFVSLTAHKKARIAMTCGVSTKTIKNAIIEYIKAGILIRVGRAEYELSPHLFAKGKWWTIRERRREFTARLTYSLKGGRTIETETSGAEGGET